MKKFRLFIIAVICLFVVGCGEKKVVKTCTIENDQSINGYKSVITFTISATGNNVVELKQKEVIESEKKDIIDFYKNDFETTYKSYSKNYGGYTYHIDVKDNQLIVDATINYKKFNMKKYLQGNPGFKKIVNKKNLFDLNSFIEMYQGIGAVCK